MKNKTSKHINSQGSTYYAANAYGWSCAKTPWEALAKLDLYGNGKKVNTLSSRNFEDATDHTMLFFIPDESKFAGTEYYVPVDEKGEQIGVCLFASTSERNERIVKERLS
jgi:hypothetical protein